MICPICQLREVLSTNPDVTSCLDCQHTGREFEFYLTSPVRSNMLGRIRDLDHVLSANVWPMGQGNYRLGIFLKDGRLVVTGAAVQAGENVFAVIAAIPPVGEKWVVGVQTPLAAPDEWLDGTDEMIKDLFDDDGVVDTIAGLA